MRAQFSDLQPKTHKVAMRLPLQESADAQWNVLDRKLRNQVRKADKSGLTVEIGGEELADEFYDVFAENMRDLGTPVYDFRFFLEILRTFPESARVFVVRRDQKAIAASDHLSRVGVDGSPVGLVAPRAQPSVREHRLYWAMLATASPEDARVRLRAFDAGRRHLPFQEAVGSGAAAAGLGVRDRRRQALPDLSPKNPKFQRLVALWQHLPLWLANAAGPGIVRGIP